MPRRNSSVGDANSPPLNTELLTGLPASAGPISKDETPSPLVWLVFGASGHLGRSLISVALARGDTVFPVGKAGTDEPTLHNLYPNVTGGVCDVRDRESVQLIVQRATRTCGRIDIVVNSAGYGVIGACEDQDEYEIRNQMETNFMGTYNIMHLTVPYFRERGSGRYIIFSSTSGFLGLPGLGPYCASKWAVEGLVESLMFELEPFNIQVSLVTSGFSKRDEPEQEVYGALPNWGHFLIANQSAPYSGITSPASHARRMVQWIQNKQITSGVKVAEMVWELAHCQLPPLRLLLGHHAIESLRDRLRFTLEEIEDWKHIYQTTDEPETAVANDENNEAGVDDNDEEVMADG